ncbi:STAS domain-containing protein [Streptacidiphilus sp. ASG 303]|uniref:STAS domain-containing protein n=1 Tax=Streptomycetaceae TaxID=2062 RepID=UPI001E5FA7A9|nr:STAS domain-containing protein [Streptacidiphilus sp. ASG 303]MCD0480880.1 STAS domain-containing protein [Streptacidiphilus sp. ASG 303]
MQQAWEGDLEVEARAHGACALLVLRGEIDHDNVDELEGALDSALRDGARYVVLDVSGVGFGDSSMVNALLGAWRSLSARSGGVRLVGVSPAVDQLLATLGIRDRLPQYPTVDDALRDA